MRVVTAASDECPCRQFSLEYRNQGFLIFTPDDEIDARERKLADAPLPVYLFRRDVSWPTEGMLL